MKRLVAVLAAATVVATAAPAGAQVFPSVAAGQFADASWTVRENGKLVVYFAFVMRMVGEDGVVSYAAVGKGKCHETPEFIICTGTRRGREIPLDAFEMDPLLSSARLDFKTGGQTHSVTWTGHGRFPSVGAGAAAGDLGVIAGFSADRSADANGRVLGRKLTRRQSDFSSLSQEAFAGADAFVGEGTVRVKRTFRFPR